jgi:hypothetical protein
MVRAGVESTAAETRVSGSTASAHLRQYSNKDNNHASHLQGAIRISLNDVRATVPSPRTTSHTSRTPSSGPSWLTSTQEELSYL